jgi:transcriptional regulator with XRE-family HTH domain
MLTFAIWQIILMNMDDNNQENLGKIIRQQRVTLPLTLQQLSAMSRVSASHLGRIEKGQRFPSAPILRKIARPLGFDEDELFTLAGYLSPQPQSPSIAENNPEYSSGRLDPYIARTLAKEPVEVQHAVLGILTILKSIAKSIVKETS